ncbi:hypothetical protein ACQ7B2_29900, partial [Escherichia coli]
DVDIVQVLSAEVIKVNRHEQMAGWTDDADCRPRAVLWSAANVIDNLGTLGGRWSEALGLNELGHVVGVS